MGCACSRPRGEVPDIHYTMKEALVRIPGGAYVDGCEITIFCEGKQYVSNHIYPEFLGLEEKISKVLNGKPWVNCELPKVKKLLSKDFKDDKAFKRGRYDACEDFVRHIVENPCLITTDAIEFFNIGEPHKSVFKKYQSELQKTTS
jgi:hypothetical protein